MSTDTFQFEIARIDGSVVELACTPLAGGANDYAHTRSFVLLCLEAAVRDVSCPLERALRQIDLADRGADADFHAEHVGTFLEWAKLVGRESSPPGFRIQAKVASPEWLEGLRIGPSWGTTAYDVWTDDESVPAAPAASEATTLASNFASLLLEREVVALADGSEPAALAELLVPVFEATSKAKQSKMLVRLLVDEPLIDELFAEDEQIVRALEEFL